MSDLSESSQVNTKGSVKRKDYVLLKELRQGGELIKPDGKATASLNERQAKGLDKEGVIKL